MILECSLFLPKIWGQGAGSNRASRTTGPSCLGVLLIGLCPALSRFWHCSTAQPAADTYFEGWLLIEPPEEAEDLPPLDPLWPVPVPQDEGHSEGPRRPQWMGWVAGLFHVLVSLYLLVWLGGIDGSDRAGAEPGVSRMPAAGESRYYRTGPATGYELELMRRYAAGRGQWIVMLPDTSLRRLDITHRATVTTTPSNGVDYLPRPVLGPQRRTELAAQAGRMATGAEASRELGLYGRVEPTTHLRRLLALTAGVPAVGARWVRWGLRSPWRFAGMCCALFIVYEALSHVGLFDKLEGYVRGGIIFAKNLKTVILEASETAKEWYEWMENVHGMISGFIEPWRLVAYLFSVALLTWAGTRGSTSSPPSATSSADHSEAGSPVVGDSPPNELVQQVTSSVSAAMNQQKALLDRLIELQSARLARDEEQEVETRAREIRTEARQEEAVATHDLRSRRLLFEVDSSGNV